MPCRTGFFWRSPVAMIFGNPLAFNVGFKAESARCQFAPIVGLGCTDRAGEIQRRVGHSNVVFSTEPQMLFNSALRTPISYERNEKEPCCPQEDAARAEV